jgi:hypothetical protein
MQTQQTNAGTLKLRVWAGVLAVLWGYFFFGLIDLLVFLEGPAWVENTMLDTGWGLLFLVLVAGPLVAVATAPGTTVVTAVQQIYLVAGAVAVGAAVTASPEAVFVVAGLAGTAQLLAGCTDAPGSWLRRTGHWSWWPGVVVCAGTAPGMAYVAACASAARNDPTPDLTWDVNHWPVQAALPLAVLAAAALAATYPPGWRVPAWCASVSAIWFGVLAWTHPDLDASVGQPWAATTIGWGLVFLVAVHLGARRDRSQRGSRGAADSDAALPV